MAPSRDTVHINELLLTLSIDNVQAHPQPVSLSLAIPHDTTDAARADDLAYAIDYAAVYATLVDTLPKTRYPSPEAVAEHALGALFRSHPRVDEARVAVAVRSALACFTVETVRTRDQAPAHPDGLTIRALGFSTLIGVRPRERTERQPVVFDITVRRRHPSASQGPFPFVALSTSIPHTFGPSAYLTVEALASAVACHVLELTGDPNDEATVKLSKPNALTLAACPQIQITRQRDDFPDVFSSLRCLPPTTTRQAENGGSSLLHSVALALGSNLGDRFANIEIALRLLELPRSLLSDLPEHAEVAVVDTSFMYETAPMYVTDQPRFVNCACMIETNLSPKDLLRLVKEVETAVGRVPGVRYGPRTVDLDILTYDHLLLDTRPLESRANLDSPIGELVIPHPRLCEREFVLRPLNDMIPLFVHPVRKKTIRTLLDELVSGQTEDDFPMLKVMPFPKYPSDGTEINGVKVVPTATYWTLSSTNASTRRQRHPCKTHLMAILNVTPDSFSDGAQHNTPAAAIAYATAAIAAGADIIDIGGYSTRPRADVVSPEEEVRRVVPVIQAIRAHTDSAVRRALVSVDTFRWDMAERAVLEGANCINDVHAFTGPTYPPDAASAEHLAQMRGVARRLGVPVVLMHSRGEAGANKDYDAYPGGLVSGIQTELGRKVDAIVRGRGGVRRWLVVVDPGIGFSKPVDGELAVMRELGRVTAEEGGNALRGYPLLVGPSKKSALGAVLEACTGRKTTAQERGWATAAAVACAVQQGANVVRVHDVAEMKDVVAVASAIWSR